MRILKSVMEKLLRRRRHDGESHGTSASATFDLYAAVAALFEQHGIRSARHDNYLHLPDQGYVVQCLVFPGESERSCQLDVRFVLPDGATITESFGGIGDDADAATKNGFEYFARSSFHVFLRSLLTGGADDQVDVEAWAIGGHVYTATIGPATGRGTSPDSVVPTAWFPAFESAIKSAEITEDICWIRLYYGHMNGATLALEVLRNNEPWLQLEDMMKSVAWPKSRDFYSGRLFLILRRQSDR